MITNWSLFTGFWPYGEIHLQRAVGWWKCAFVGAGGAGWRVLTSAEKSAATVPPAPSTPIPAARTRVLSMYVPVQAQGGWD